MSITYMAFDPGDTTGVAAYDLTGNLIWMLQYPEAKLVMALMQHEANFNPDGGCRFFIIENFRIFPTKAQKFTYSDITTLRVIGRLECFATERNIQVVKQGIDARDTGYKYLGQTKPTKSNPLNHAADANAHGIYWLVNNCVLNARSLL